MKKRKVIIFFVFIILVFVMISIGLFYIVNYNGTKQNDNEYYICTIRDEKVDSYEIENKIVNYNIIRKYYFDFADHKIQNGVVEFSYTFANLEDYYALSVDLLTDLKFDKLDRNNETLTQKRITNLIIGADTFMKEHKRYDASQYIKFLSQYGIHDCKTYKKEEEK